MDEAQEVERVKGKIIKRVQAIVKWKDVEDFINLPREDMKAFIEGELQVEADERRDKFAKKELDEAVDLEAIKEKVKEIET